MKAKLVSESLNENFNQLAHMFAGEMESLEDQLIKTNRGAWGEYEKESGDFWTKIGARDWLDVYRKDPMGAYAFKEKLESLINLV
ncbi:hypothetical protein KY334_01215 [Candidatus Woesearchaeota archaeon]|nr:hypothetical protein [Candidatus Woesearchaeota archaeon]